MSQNIFDIRSTQVLRETAQALQEARKMARSIETVCSSLYPLATPETGKKLSEIEEHAMTIAREFGLLYNKIAKDAFGGADGR